MTCATSGRDAARIGHLDEMHTGVDHVAGADHARRQLRHLSKMDQQCPQLPMRMLFILVGVSMLVPVLQSQDGLDLPEQDVFFAAVLENLADSTRVQNEYAYKERRTELHTNPFGRLGTGGNLLYEVIPLADGNGYTRRLLQRGGEVVEDAEVEREKRRPRQEPRRRSSTEDVWSVLDFKLDRRDTFDDRPAVVVTFAPRPGAMATTRQGRLARAFSGEVWIDEEAREVRHVRSDFGRDDFVRLGCARAAGQGHRGHARAGADRWRHLDADIGATDG